MAQESSSNSSVRNLTMSIDVHRARILCHASQAPHVSRVWTLRNHEKGKL